VHTRADADTFINVLTCAYYAQINKPTFVVVPKICSFVRTTVVWRLSIDRGLFEF